MTTRELAKKLLKMPNVRVCVSHPSIENTIEDIEYKQTVYSGIQPHSPTIILRGVSLKDELANVDRLNLLEKSSL